MIKKLLLTKLLGIFDVNPSKVTFIEAFALPASDRLFPAEEIPTHMRQKAVFTPSVKLIKPISASSQRSFGVNGNRAF